MAQILKGETFLAGKTEVAILLNKGEIENILLGLLTRLDNKFKAYRSLLNDELVKKELEPIMALIAVFIEGKIQIKE